MMDQLWCSSTQNTIVWNTLGTLWLFLCSNLEYASHSCIVWQVTPPFIEECKNIISGPSQQMEGHLLYMYRSSCRGIAYLLDGSSTLRWCSRDFPGLHDRSECHRLYVFSLRLVLTVLTLTLKISVRSVEDHLKRLCMPYVYIPKRTFQYSKFNGKAKVGWFLEWRINDEPILPSQSVGKLKLKKKMDFFFISSKSLSRSVG